MSHSRKTIQPLSMFKDATVKEINHSCSTNLRMSDKWYVQRWTWTRSVTLLSYVSLFVYNELKEYKEPLHLQN